MHKNYRNFLIIVALGLILLIGLTYSSITKNAEAPDETGETITVKNKKLSVEIADSIPEQMLGLSGRESLPENSGVLFVFPTPLNPGFWMKDMKFSIDVIWIDENRVIIGVEKNLAPETFPTNYFPPSPVKYVLEVNAGWTDRNGIKAGDTITLSSQL